MGASEVRRELTGIALLLFAVFLAGWGTSLVWGPIADRWGRTRTLAAAVACYAVFTAAAALAQNVWQLGVFRFFAGIGIGTLALSRMVLSPSCPRAFEPQHHASP